MPTVEPTERIEAFWHGFRTARSDLDPTRGFVEAFSFGEADEMADELAALVLRGVKTATSELLWSLEARGVPLWHEGDFSVVVWSSGDPACVIQTVELRVVPFAEVDEGFAFDYGEGDRTLTWWRKHLWDYYAAECARFSREPEPTMPLVCERFRVVFPAPPSLV